MSWRVQGQGGRFVAQDDKGALTADAETEVDGMAFAGRPVPITPTGPTYTPTGDDDPVWWFLLALHQLPGKHTITGTPPPVPPAAAGDVDQDVVF